MTPTTEAGRHAEYELCHFERCAGMKGPNDCDCGVAAAILAIEAEAARSERERIVAAVETARKAHKDAVIGSGFTPLDDSMCPTCVAFDVALQAVGGPTQSGPVSAGYLPLAADRRGRIERALMDAGVTRNERAAVLALIDPDRQP